MIEDGRSGLAWTRRSFIAAAGSCVAAAATAAGTRAAPHRIDVHGHIIPPQYLDEAPPSAAMQRSRQWSPERALEEMDRNGIATSMLSFSTPYLWHPGVEAGRRLARLCNDYSAGLVRDRPARFGLMAGLPPLDDTEGCLNEIRYAYDELKADGLAVLTSYGQHYLGDDAFTPVMEELNRRGAVVFVHPADPACCADSVPGVIPAYAEFPFDTARTIISLWINEALLRFPNIKFIFSHGGGALPMILDRIDKFGRPRPGGTQDAIEQVRRLYFDVANAANPAALAALRAMADPTHILFGTDYPYIPAARAVEGLQNARLDRRERRAIDRGNALALFPRLAAIPAP